MTPFEDGMSEQTVGAIGSSIRSGLMTNYGKRSESMKCHFGTGGMIQKGLLYCALFERTNKCAIKLHV